MLDQKPTQYRRHLGRRKERAHTNIKSGRRTATIKLHIVVISPLSKRAIRRSIEQAARGKAYRLESQPKRKQSGRRWVSWRRQWLEIMKLSGGITKVSQSIECKLSGLYSRIWVFRPWDRWSNVCLHHKGLWQILLCIVETAFRPFTGDGLPVLMRQAANWSIEGRRKNAHVKAVSRGERL